MEIDQTLHGYSEGHRLLAASCELQSQTERLLLKFSDLSGDGVISGFEEYLTVYPLPETKKKLAFAKTWYAEEMERPGCVWTQTLVLTLDQLADLESPIDLLGLFTRPQKGDSFSSYKTKLRVVRNGRLGFPAPSCAHHAEPMFEALARKIFSSVYQYKRSIVLLTRNAKALEPLVLDLWWQQWVDLRVNFSFCTGALSPRLMPNAQPFTVQIGPEQNYSLFTTQSREANNAIDLIEVATLNASKLKTWYEIPLSNLLRGDEQGFVKFVRRFGPTIAPSRTSFSRLTQIFWRMREISTEHHSLAELTKLLKLRFPKSTDASEIKAAIYGDKEAWSFLNLMDSQEIEIDLLKELIETEHSTIFDVSKLALDKRIHRLWEQHPEDASLITHRCVELTLTDPNEIRQEFFSASGKYAPVNEIISLTQTNTTLMETLLRINPAIAESPQLWRLDENRQRYLFAALKNITVTSKDEDTIISEVPWQEVAFAMLMAGSDIFSQPLEQLLGSKLADLILHWHQQMSSFSRDVGEGWVEVLSHYPCELLNWVQLNSDQIPGRGDISTYALIATVLNPHSEEVRNAGNRIWVNFAKSVGNDLKPSQKIQAMSFLLAMGLGGNDNEAIELVSQSFQSVYDAAKSDALPWRSWSQLERLAPSYGLIWSWDKCHRLEEALVNKIIKCGWKSEILLKAVKSPETFRQVVKRANDSSRGRKLLRELGASLDAGHVFSDVNIRKILDRV